MTLLRTLPLVSAILWLGIGFWSLGRRQLQSPYEGKLTIIAVLLGLTALDDWYIHGLADPATGTVSDPGFAVAVSNVRITIITFATLALLVAAKWLYAGHSRYDWLLLLPVAGSLAIIWGGLTSNAASAAWGPRLIRNPFLYSLWAAQQVAYVGTAIALAFLVYHRRVDLAARLRRRMFATAGSLLALLGFWLSPNIYDNVTQTAGVPWFSSLLLVPAAVILVALMPLSPAELGEMFRGFSGVQERVVAVYVFYRSGEPLVALGSTRNLPIEADQLQGILEVVGNFVETSMQKFQGYSVTSMRFDPLGILAVRGQYVIVAAVHDGRAYDALRSEILRRLRDFEARRWAQLESWENATQIAEEIADDLSSLLHRPVPRPSGLPGQPSKPPVPVPSDGKPAAPP